MGGGGGSILWADKEADRWNPRLLRECSSTFFAKRKSRAQKGVPGKTGTKRRNLGKPEIGGTVRYRIEWAGGCCYLHTDDDGEATEQGRDLAEDMGREVAVLAQAGDGWRCVGMGVPQPSCDEPPFGQKQMFLTQTPP